MLKRFVLALLLLKIAIPVHAEEGLWLPIFLKQLNEADMQARGMKVTAEDIYSVNKSSMKDAVVLFGGGCTGEMISGQGLLLTNHHCGFSQIQSHSTVEHDYLKDGFWAYKAEEEIPCPGLSVTFIIKIEDVTSRIFPLLSDSLSEKERELKIKEISKQLEKEFTEGTHYTASVKPFYNGNQFFIFIQEVFTDVRLVGTPPSSIGKFGGDTDNWMWPRHTGDFSMFRVYASADNKPAAYAASNVPFKPRHFFPISLKGVVQGDFTMVYGFPGRTTEYIPSYAVKNVLEVNNPARIKIRTARLEIIDKAMQSSPKLRIQYAAKQASIANAWKKWQGESKGLMRLKTLEEKQIFETGFTKWVEMRGRDEYKDLMKQFEAAYTEIAPLSKTNDYINEAAYGVEVLKYARGLAKLVTLAQATPVDEQAVGAEAQKIVKGLGGFFRDFDVATDKKLFEAMMTLYLADVNAAYHPELLLDKLKKHKNDARLYADDLYAESAFTDSAKVKSILDGFTSKNISKITSDPAWQLAESFNQVFTTKLDSAYTKLNETIGALNRKYMAAQLEMVKGRPFYPDANSTLRVAYGQVNGYQPRDGVIYKHYSTLEGVLEKEDVTIEEFEVPVKLKELYKQKNYGPYGMKNVLPLAFIASNHTTGGNSGSPVINANGELIGTNFDRVWEGTMSDIDFDSDLCRNIALDIRYTLFIVDKFAGCQRLIDEMQIVK